MEVPSSREFLTRLLLFLGLVLLLLWGGWGLYFWQKYDDRLAAAESMAKSTALTSDEHVKRLLQAVDLAMQGQVAAIARLGRPLESAAEEIENLIMGSDTAFARAFAKAFTFAVFDARGHGVAASEPGFNRTASFADREYFRVHVEQPGRGLYVGEPLFGRTYGKRFFSLSRRIEAPGGRFLGVIMGSVDAAYLAEYFAANDLGPHALIALINSQHKKIVARVPEFETTFGAEAGHLQALIQVLSGATSGTFRSSSPVDRIKRVYAFRKLDGYPLLIAVGVAEAHVRGAVFGNLPQMTAALLGVSLVLIAGAWVVMRTQRRMEEASRLAVRIIETSPIGISLHDGRDGMCIAANQAMADLLRTGRDAVIGTPLAEGPLRTAEGLDAAAARAMETKESQHWEGRIGEDAAAPVWASGRLVALRERDHRRLMIMLEDRTAEKTSERALRTSQQALNEAQRVAQLGNWSIDMPTGRVTCSDEAYRLLGLPRNKMLTLRDFRDVLLPEDRPWVLKVWNRSISPDTAINSIEHRIRRDGHVRWLQEIADLTYDSQGKLTSALVTCQDITERKQAEEALREKNLALEQSNAELEAFAYVASHDLREPLRSVASFTTLLQRRLAGRLSTEEAEYLNFVNDGAMRMDSLVRDLLTFSRVGREDASLRPVVMGEVVDSVLMSLRGAIAETGAEIVVPPDLPVIEARAEGAYQLFLNLIGNALKYRSPDRAPRVEIACRIDDDDWHFTVRDNGIGIESGKGYETRIFRLFQRLHHRDLHGGGTGVGLAICHKIVERHGGRIWVESPGLDQGSTFHVRWPGMAKPQR